MKIRALLLTCFVIFTTICNAQNALSIINGGDTAIGTYVPVTLTGAISNFIISQTKVTASNKTYYEGPILPYKAQIDTFYCKRTFFRNFNMRNCVLKGTVIFDSVPSANLTIDSNLFQRGLK